MLARVYALAGRYQQAAALYEALSILRPQDADLLVDYADALARARQNRFAGEPAALLERALTLTPDHARALWLAGFAALQAGNRAAAVGHWQALLTALDADSPVYQQVEQLLMDMETGTTTDQP